MKQRTFNPDNDFGIWSLPATIGAVKRARDLGFEPAHYDAVERDVRRAGNTEITRQDVENVQLSRATGEAGICGQCGRFHAPPACGDVA